MKKVRFLITLALLTPALKASEGHRPLTQHHKALLTIISTQHNRAIPGTASPEEWQVVCTPTAQNLLERIQFAQTNDRWTSNIVASHDTRSQEILSDPALPLIDPATFRVYFDDATKNITFAFSPKPAEISRIET